MGETSLLSRPGTHTCHSRISRLQLQGRPLDSVLSQVGRVTFNFNIPFHLSLISKPVSSYEVSITKSCLNFLLRHAWCLFCPSHCMHSDSMPSLCYREEYKFWSKSQYYSPFSFYLISPTVQNIHVSTSQTSSKLHTHKVIQMYYSIRPICISFFRLFGNRRQDRKLVTEWQLF